MSLATRYLFTLLLLAGISGCSTTEPEPPAEAVEVKSKAASTVDAPEAELLYAAKRLYAAGLYSVAIENFESLRNGYPQGPYAEFAEIKVADGHFELREYDLAVQTYEGFLKDRPASTTLPYAMLRAGRSYHLSFKGLGRDTAPLVKALEWYDRLIATYPDSVYALTGRQFRIEVIDQLAESDLMIAEFYRKADELRAAEARENQYREKWSPIIATLQPKVVTVSRGSAVDKLAGAQPVSSELVTPNVQQITRGGLFKDDSTTKIVAARNGSTPLPAPESSRSGGLFDFSRWRIQNIQCTTQGGNKLFIVLNQPFTDQNFLDTNGQISVSTGTLELALPSTSGRDEVRDCFGSDDLIIAADGHISLRAPNGSKARLMALDNPARIAVLFGD